jgi:hypothetical protein
MKSIYGYALAFAASAFISCSDDIPSQESLDWYVAKRGYTAEDITNIQRFINCNGSYLKVTGKYDRETALDVMVFQGNEKLKDREGLAGKKTLERMLRKCAEINCDSTICAGLEKIKK